MIEWESSFNLCVTYSRCSFTVTSAMDLAVTSAMDLAEIEDIMLAEVPAEPRKHIKVGRYDQQH